MFFFWPVLITQIWGLVTQAKLDDKALEIAMQVAYANGAKHQQGNASGFGPDKFCTSCGAKVSDGAKFCGNCGKQV